MVRKGGKLPPAMEPPCEQGSQVLRVEYTLEYGKASLELPGDAFSASKDQPSRVVVVDDLVATGGSAVAACNLLCQAGATVEEVAVLIELTGFLNGRKKIKEEASTELYSLLQFEEQ